MKNAQSKKPPNIVWTFLSSVKLTIVLLILLAIVSILGTVIPQGQEASQFAQTLKPRHVSILFDPAAFRYV
jgi:hypothetical protein